MALLNLHHKKKQELVKNKRLHPETSSVTNEEETGLHVALFPPLLLGKRSGDGSQ